MSYAVRLPSGKIRGVLELSYKFGEPFTMAAPLPVMVYRLQQRCPPRARLLHTPRRCTGWRHTLRRQDIRCRDTGIHRTPHPDMVTLQQGYGYLPPQCYRYQPQGYEDQLQGHGYPRQGYQQPAKKHGSGAGGLGLELAGGLLGRLVIRDMISDA